MPLGWVGFAVKGGLILAFVLVILWIFRWIWRAGQDRQILRETQDRLRQEEEARRKEREIREAVDKARSDPGPAIPDLGMPGRIEKDTPP